MITPRAALRPLGILALLLSCAYAQPQPDPIPCDTWDQCYIYDGQRVALTGTYTLHYPLASLKGGQNIHRARITFPNGRGVYLAPYWHPDSARAPAERAAFEGQQVRVIGRLWLKAPPPPDPRASTMGGPCLYPVEHIGLASSALNTHRATPESKTGTDEPSQNLGRQVLAPAAPIDPQSVALFCHWNRLEDVLPAALADYAQGHRRAPDAWRVIHGRHLDPNPREQSICWQGALHYLGLFGPGDALPKLTELLTDDPILRAELEQNRPAGAPDLGLDRLVALYQAGLPALAAQLRRQRAHTGHLDGPAQIAQRLIQRCATHQRQCMPQIKMNRAARDLFQLGAVRGLAISGTPADLRALDALRASRGGDDPVVMRAVSYADHITRWLSTEDAAQLIASLPAPEAPKPTLKTRRAP